MIVWAWLAAGATEPSDISVTSVGVQSVQSNALGAADPDLLLGQRLRWRIGEGPWSAHANARFTIDPDGPTTFEQSRVRSLGVVYGTGALELQLGRHALRYGGARLLDGVQVMAYPRGRHGLGVGGWAGLQADPFTTRPVVRPGAGPIVSYETSVITASAVGEIVAGPEGLDRGGVILQATGNWAPRVFAHARLDWLFPRGKPSGLSDGIVSVSWQPSRDWTFDLDYNAYSSIRYQTVGNLDPGVQRFVQRVDLLDLNNIVLGEAVDPTVKHQVGARAALQPQTSLPRPVISVDVGVRRHPDPAEQLVRITPRAGFAGLFWDRLEITGDVDLIHTELRWQGSAGAQLLFDALPSGAVVVDTSARVLVDRGAYGDRPGWYADLFVDAVAPTKTMIALGASWTHEPSDGIANDVGWAAFLWVQQWIRRKPRPAPERGDTPIEGVP